MGGMQVGTAVEVAYDVPPDAWYFRTGSAEKMPFCVLLEAALQPCGWLASFVGCALQDPGELFNWHALARLRLALPRPTRNLVDPGWPDAGFIMALERFGYDVTDETAAVTAFQRRFRPELIDGGSELVDGGSELVSCCFEPVNGGSKLAS